MRIDLSTIPRDSENHVLPPTVILKTRSDSTIGSLGYYHNLELHLKYTELSEGTFSIPASVDDVAVPFYDKVVKGATIQIDPYGVFVISNTDVQNDGVSEIKTVSLYSREYELSSKKLVFAAGTYNFYNPVDPTDTLLGMFLEKTKNWTIGEVDSSLYGRYRTFDDTQTNIIDFAYGEAQASYECIFEFDVYNRKINVKDANSVVNTLPIYLSLDNLIENMQITDSDDNIATVLNVYGADPVTIRDVNPIGTSSIYNLGYYISTGEIPEDVKTKYLSWKNKIVELQPSFKNFVALRASASSRYIIEAARLTDYKNELANKDNLRIVKTQALALATTEASKLSLQADLQQIAIEYLAIESKIQAQETLLTNIKNEQDGYSASINAVVNQLKLSSFFTPAELKVLDHYFSEEDFSDTTFAVFDVDISGAKDSYKTLSAMNLSFSDVVVHDVAVAGGTHSIFDIASGKLSIAEEGYSVSGDIIKCTYDYLDGEAVLSFYLGKTTINDEVVSGVTLTCVGSTTMLPSAFLSSLTQKSIQHTDEERNATYTEIYYEGSITLPVTNGTVYITRSVSDYQQISVSQELYDFAQEQHKKAAYPTYQFEIQSGNFIFSSEFIQFSEEIKLGSAVYLRLNENKVLEPILLEISLDFESPENFSLVFSNEFQRNDSVKTMQDIIKKASSTSHSFDMAKFEYGSWKSSGGAGALAEFLKNGVDTAYQTVVGGSNNNVIFDKSGISIKADGDSDYLKLANGMIAIINDTDKTAKTAIGKFHNIENNTDYFGINTDVLAGKLLTGVQLFIESSTLAGNNVTQFKVDSTGVFLNNSRFYLQSVEGGRMGLDPNYGFFGGAASLFNVTDTGYVTPSFIDTDGTTVLYDENGFPKDANFWIDINGNSWFKGTVYATAGEFTGKIKAQDFLLPSGDSFQSVIDNQGKIKSDFLDLGNIQLDGVTGDINMSGNITMGGNINLSGGSITWGNNSPVKYQFSVDGVNNWHDTMATTDKYRRDSLDGGITWGNAYQFKGSDGQNGSDAYLPTYITNTIISEGRIAAPIIEANDFSIYPNSNTDFDGAFNIHGNYDHVSHVSQYHFFQIRYSGTGGADSTPAVMISSPGGASIRFISTGGDFDFSGATVHGLRATFG